MRRKGTRIATDARAARTFSDSEAPDSPELHETEGVGSKRVHADTSHCLRIQSAIINRRGRTSGFHETARRSARYCPAAPDAPQGCPRGARRSAALTRAGRRQPWHRWIDAWVCPRADAGRHDGGARFLDLRPHSTDPMCAHSQATALRPARSRMRMCPWRSRMYPLSWSATAAIDTVDRGHPSTWASRSWVRSML